MCDYLKTRSIRADNQSFEKFKVISKGFQNQAQAFAMLISLYENTNTETVAPKILDIIDMIKQGNPLQLEYINDLLNQIEQLNKIIFQNSDTIKNLSEIIVGYEKKDREVDSLKNDLFIANFRADVLAIEVTKLTDELNQKEIEYTQIK